MCPYSTPMCPILPCAPCRRSDECAQQAELDRRLRRRTGLGLTEHAYAATACNDHPGLTKGECQCTA